MELSAADDITTRARILVVDDERVIRSLLRDVLTTVASYDVVEAADGLDAQRILSEGGEFDVVISDIAMPQLSGMELMQWAKKECPGPSWIILSGNPTLDNAVQAVHLGAYDFIRKPMDVVNGLLVTVRNVLHKRHVEQERDMLLKALGAQNTQLAEACDLLRTQSGRLDQDLRRADLIQRSLLPRTSPDMKHFSVNAIYRPCQSVGGDIYDVILADERHAVLYVADAAGHGVSAAMLAVLFKNRIGIYDHDGCVRHPREILKSVNDALRAECSAPGLFITAAVGVLDLEEGQLAIASAGHVPLLIQRSGGWLERVYHTGPALGIMANAEFSEKLITLHEGDRLLMYTDGIFDAEAESESLTPEYLEYEIGRAELTGDELLHDLQNTAEQRRDGRSQEDDVMLLLLTCGAGESTLDNGSPEAVHMPVCVEKSHAAAVLVGNEGGTRFISVDGRATWTFSTAFYEKCKQCIDDDEPCRIVLDLSLCTYMDSTFLGTMLELVTITDAGGQDFRIQGVLPQVREAFEELGMDAVLNRISTEMHALPTHMEPAAGVSVGCAPDAGRVLASHEALASLSEENRREFAALIEGLQKETSVMG